MKYYWRSLTDEQREEVRTYRRLGNQPRHSLPHFDSDENRDYLITGTCYEHKHIVGASPSRMQEFCGQLLDLLTRYSENVSAWCLLPNHYHALARTRQIKELRKQIGLFHGRTSFKWNGEDGARGRTVWRNCFERKIRSERHYFATVNYILHNPVHHGYVQSWEEWPWSNASEYLTAVGREAAVQIWNEFPVLDYGAGWDED
jgi:putative transposase